MTNQAALSLWNTNDLQNPHELADKQRRVRRMFSDLAGVYDLGNHVLSLNLDRIWRKKAVGLMNLQAGQRVLDLCCGTGDMVLAILEARNDLGTVIGVDFAEPMLREAIKKYSRVSISEMSGNHKCLTLNWLCANAAMTGLAGGYFDRISCAFGLRNMQQPKEFLREVYRLLKPGGRSVVLEFAMPASRLLRCAYQCYFRLVLPMIGCMITGDRNRAYHYLAGSVNSFPDSKTLRKQFLEAGFRRVETTAMSGGVVMAYQVEKG
jgi:demethylmenaquinone methyltransferase / 2-methoxy-6-polyprenyl-1,4-benzoquinol methylase